MPTLPLPLGGTVLTFGDLPVVDQESIAALEPHFVAASDNAPVRDAIRAALVAMFCAYQDETARAAMQSNVLFATGVFLDGLGQDEGVFRQAESEPYTRAGDDAYRARIIVQGGTVTPDIILAAVNSILADYSDVPAVYLESMLDRGYCRSDTTTPYIAYVRNGVVAGNVDPTYPDRLFEDDEAENLGLSIPDRHPGGFFCFSDTFGRLFVLRIPLLSSVDNAGAFASSETLGPAGSDPGYPDGFGIFCTDGSVVPIPEWSFFRDAPATAVSVYQSIVNTVNRLVAHSVRWALIPDPLLTA